MVAVVVRASSSAGRAQSHYRHTVSPSPSKRVTRPRMLTDNSLIPSGLTSRTVAGGSCTPALQAFGLPAVQIAHGHSCLLLCGVGT